jgi:hypothetical protein
MQSILDKIAFEKLVTDYTKNHLDNELLLQNTDFVLTGIMITLVIALIVKVLKIKQKGLLLILCLLSLAAGILILVVARMQYVLNVKVSQITLVSHKKEIEQIQILAR